MVSHVMRFLEHVHLRSTDERRESAPRVSSRRGSGAIVKAGATACYVNVSRRSQASPGAACSRYHDREGVEVLRDADIDEWRGDRCSIILSPSERVDLVALTDRFLEELEKHFGTLRGSAWLHHAERSGGERDHVHVAVDSNGGRVLITQRTAERAAAGALRTMARDKARSVSR